MINSKLIRLLKVIDTDELANLQDFVASPYFNKKKRISDLLTILAKFHPKFPPDSTSHESIFSRLYPHDKYDQKKIGYLQSDLFKLVLQFLKFEKRNSIADLALASELAERKLDKLYNSEIKSLEKETRLLALNGASKYKFKYELYDLKDRHFINLNKRKDDENAHLASENLDLYYVCRKLQYFVVLLNRNQTIGIDLKNPQLKFIMNYVEENFLDNPLINAYYEIIMMHTQAKPLPHFYNLRKTIKQHHGLFSSKEIYEVYEEAINFCVKRISFDQKFYVGEALQLNMEFLSSGYMYKNGILSHWYFKNIIKLGLLLERFNFVEQFILKYIDKVSSKNKIKALHYNLAELQFARQKFDSAQEHLSILFQEDLELPYTLGSRMMLIKIFQQNNEEEALLSQIAAFAIFLKRSKNISNTKRKIYLNFCDILNKILRQNPKHYLKIKTEIEQTKLLTNTSWLLKVYEELMPTELFGQSKSKMNENI